MKGYRIKTVSRVTGLSPELLRAWERRHRIVHPRRTAGGYREYSEEDVERLRLLAQLTSRGYSIGEIAPLPVDELAELVRDGAGRAAAPDVAPSGPHSVVVGQLLGLAAAGDALGFRRALRRILVILPSSGVVDSVLLPALRELAARAIVGDHLPALQLATSEIAGYLGPIADDRPAGAPLALVIAGDGGTLSDSRTLLASLACVQREWQVIRAGRLTSAREVVEGARAASATVVLISYSEPPSATALLGLLEAWGAAGPGALVVAAAELGPLAELVRERGGFVVRDHLELPAVLRDLEAGLVEPGD